MDNNKKAFLVKAFAPVSILVEIINCIFILANTRETPNYLNLSVDAEHNETFKKNLFNLQKFHYSFVEPVLYSHLLLPIWFTGVTVAYCCVFLYKDGKEKVAQRNLFQKLAFYKLISWFILSIIYTSLYIYGINKLSEYDLAEDIKTNIAFTTYSLFAILATVNLNFLFIFMILLTAIGIMACCDSPNPRKTKNSKHNKEKVK